MKTSQPLTKLHSAGFTLIELIIGIVVLAISFSLLTTLILPLSEKSAEQLHQVRASELGQSMMNEIMAKAFDHNSDMTGGLVRCGEDSTVCTANLGVESNETERAHYNDVDDYIAFDFSTESNDAGDKYVDLYPGFTMRVTVCYSNFSASCSSNIELAKRVIITVTTPQNFDFVFSFYRANF